MDVYRQSQCAPSSIAVVSVGTAGGEGAQFTATGAASVAEPTQTAPYAVRVGFLASALRVTVNHTVAMSISAGGALTQHGCAPGTRIILFHAI